MAVFGNNVKRDRVKCFTKAFEFTVSMNSCNVEAAGLIFSENKAEKGFHSGARTVGGGGSVAEGNITRNGM